MTQFDNPQLHPPADYLALQRLVPDRPAFVHQIRLDDESISPALRGVSLDPVNAGQWREEYLRSQVRQLLSTVRESAEAVRNLALGAQVFALTEMNPSERGELLGRMLAAGCSIGNYRQLFDTIYRGTELGREQWVEMLQSAARYVQNVPLSIFRIAPHLEQGGFVASLSVDELLRSAAEKIPDQDSRSFYLDHRRSSRELVGVLRHLSREDRVTFFTQLLELQNPSPTVQAFLLEKLDNCLRFTTADERVAVLESIVGHQATAAQLELCAAVLRASPDRADLRAVVNAVGRDRLLAHGNSSLREVVALVALHDALEQLTQPTLLEQTPSVDFLCERSSELQMVLDRAIERVAALREFEDTKCYQDLLFGLSYNKAFLDAQLSAIASPDELQSFLRTFEFKLSLEWRYGITLTHCGADPEKGIEQRLWSEGELQQVDRALSVLSEGAVLFTPWLREIQRVPDLGESVLGARFPDGVIRIADLAINNLMVQLAYNGTPSLQHTLVHEIGHGMQLGSGGGGLEMDSETHELRFASGEPTADFDEYLRLSGWEVLASDRVEVATFGLSVKLDGVEYPTGVPIQHQGRSLILIVAGRDLVIARDAFGKFSLVPYSRTSPWEDFAEAFAEYHLQPERLIQFAPEKFKFFEEEYRKYEGRSDIQEQLRGALRPSL